MCRYVHTPSIRCLRSVNLPLVKKGQRVIPTLCSRTLKIKSQQGCPAQERGGRPFRGPPRAINNVQSQVLLRRRFKCQGSSRLRPHGARGCRACPPGPPPRASRLRVPGAEASAGPPVLVPPDPGPLSPRRESPERPASAAGSPSRRARPPRLRLGEARRAPGSRRHRPRGLRPRTRASQLDASSAEVFHVDRSLASHKMGPGSGRRRIHGRRHFVRRGGARLCVMVEESDPPPGNPRR